MHLPLPMQGNGWIIRIGVCVTYCAVQIVLTVGTAHGAVQKKAICE